MDNNSRAGMGLCGVIFVNLFILKVLELGNLTWWHVFLVPIGVTIGVVLTIFVVVFLLLLLFK